MVSHGLEQRLRERSPDAHGPGIATRTDDGDEISRRKRLVCRACGASITTRDRAVEVDGRQIHTFFNPAGLLFEIGCFRDAEGAVAVGARSGLFAWFPGTHWQIALCAACGVHLGWYFTGKSFPFHGLILNRLLESDD